MALKDGINRIMARRKLPTPRHIEVTFTIAAKVCGLAVIAVNSAPNHVVGPITASSASWFFSVAGAVLLEAKGFWVVKTTEKQVPIERVDVMEEKPE